MPRDVDFRVLPKTSQVREKSLPRWKKLTLNEQQIINIFVELDDF